MQVHNCRRNVLRKQRKDSRTDYSTKAVGKRSQKMKGQRVLNQSVRTFRRVNKSSVLHGLTRNRINSSEQVAVTSIGQRNPGVKTNECGAMSPSTMITEDPLPEMLEVSQSFQISLSSTSQTDAGSNFSERDDFSWSKKYLLPTIRTMPYTESRCFICESYDNRQNVPKEARMDLWCTKEVYLPNSIRCCAIHLTTEGSNKRVFTKDAMMLIQQKPKLTGVSLTTNELEVWIKEMTNKASQAKIVDFTDPSSVSESNYKLLIGISETDFRHLRSHLHSIKSSSNRSVENALAMLLIKLRHNPPQALLAYLFGMPSQGAVSETVNCVLTDLMKHFVPRYLGFSHKSRDDIIASHQLRHAVKTLQAPETALILVLDGTYLYTHKPSNHDLQKMLFSMHKHRPLVKFMMTVTTDGYIVSVDGPYGADGQNNDASILSHMINQANEIMAFTKDGDIVLVDRGFLKVIEELESLGLKTHMPHFLKKAQKQFTSSEAVDIRRITMLRWVVEAVNGRLKKKFRFLNDTLPLTYLPTIEKYFSVAAALLNAYTPVLATETMWHGIIQENLAVSTDGNPLEARAISEGWLNDRNMKKWNKASDDDISEFPELENDDLFEITLGVFQLENAVTYAERQIESDPYQFYKHPSEGRLLRTKVKSKMTSSRGHHVFVEYKEFSDGLTPAEQIIQHYCDCKSGAKPKSKGCCSHVSTVLWYLGSVLRQGIGRSRRKYIPYIKDAGMRV